MDHDSLVISNIDDDDDRATSKKKMVFITGRVHPGESPSSFVCQGNSGTEWEHWMTMSTGIIDYLMSDDPGAVVLRKSLIFKISKSLDVEVWQSVLVYSSNAKP